MSKEFREAFTRRQFLKGIVAAAGAISLGGAGGYAINRALNNDEEVQELKDELGRLKVRQEENLVGDCVNENIIRESLDAPPVSIEVCRQERKDWRDKVRDKNVKEI